MASLYREGTVASNTLTSRDIDVLKEELNIHINKEFQTVDYNVKYYIKTSRSGNQIPLLFISRKYYDGFKVTVDGKPIEILNIPYEYRWEHKAPDDKFNNYFDSTKISIRYIENWQEIHHIDDHKYFEIDLDTGYHLIEVNYSATPFIDRSNPVKKYTFHYLLSPLEYWNSLGSLHININSEDFEGEFTHNLGNPTQENSTKDKIWKFNLIPVETIQIRFEPVPNFLAKIFIMLSGFPLMIILGILVLIIHVRMILKHKKPISGWILHLGSFVVPFIWGLIFMLSFVLADLSIGEHASNFNGYTF